MSAKKHASGEFHEVNFFVYGTLKRGECRQNVWPRPPSFIEDAVVVGDLYDAGNYPALLPGTDKVLGEMWSFPSADFDVIVKVLDDIEEYRVDDPYNLYNREVLECETLSGRRTVAYTYVYARLQDLPTFTRLNAKDTGSEFVQWSSAK